MEKGHGLGLDFGFLGRLGFVSSFGKLGVG